MEAVENILKRRSIRKYTDKKIDEETMHKLLECGMAGPTCVNARDWAFIVVDDKELLRELSRCNGRAAGMLPDAAAAIIVCGDLNRAFSGAKDYWIEDASIATQNIILAASAMGLGAVWLGTYPQEDKVGNVKELIKLPDEIVPLSVIALGYPAEEKPDDKIIYEESRVHYNKW